jgi:hypothetical protein
MLPEFARDHVEHVADRVAFECEGEAVRGHSIMFSCLAAISGSLQRFWSAIAAESGIEPSGEWGGATLACSAGTSGSFAIEVEPRDKEAFETIAAGYKSIVRESYGDPSGIQGSLAKRRPSLAQSYGSYLRALETFKVDVLFDVGTDATFLGFDCATRVRPYVRTVKNPEERRRSETVSAIGYFDGFMKLKPKFEFFDIATGSEYKGTVSEAVLGLAHKKDIIIGRRAPKYAVQIEVTFSGDRPQKCILLTVDALGEDPKSRR